MTRWVLWILLALVPVTAVAGEVELLPAGTVWADGSTRSVVMLRVEGALPGARVKVKTRDARVRSTRVVGPDLVKIVLVPLERQDPGMVTLSVKAKGANGTVELPVVPGPTGSLVIEPGTELAWAGSGSILVRIRPEGAHPLPESRRRVKLQASAGRITSAPQRSKSGGWVARWTPPPASQAPVAVLFTATDMSAPERVLGQAVLPVQVRRTVSIEVPEGGVVIYDGETSEPVSGGTWTQRLVLHPEKLPATLRTTNPEGKVVETPLDLGDPVAPQLAFAPLPSHIPTPRPLTVWLAARNPQGGPWSGPAPELEGVGRFKRAGDGWYVVRVQPPSRTGTWTLTVRAGETVVSTKVNLVPEPAQAQVALYPFPLPPEARSAELVVRMEDRLDQGVPGLAIYPRGSGFSVQSGRVDEGDGTYVWTLRPTTRKPLVVGTKVNLATSRMPVAHVLAWTSTPIVPGDGHTTTEVYLVAVDALGRPVPKARFDLTIPVGDAHAPARVYADAYGFAVVKVIAGTRPGPVGLGARSGPISGAVVLYQASVEGTPTLEPVGTAPTRGLTERWALANVRLGVSRGPATVLERPATEEEAPPQASLRDRARPAEEEPEEDPEEVDEPEEGARRLSLAGLASGGHREATLVRARVALTDSSYHAALASSGDDKLPVSAEAQRELPVGVVGPSLEVEFFPARWSAGLELRLRGRVVGFETDTGRVPDTTSTVIAGVKWRQPLWGPLYAVGGLAAQRSTALVYRYADDAETVLRTLALPYWGPRLSAGLVYEHDRVHVEASAAETMAPLFPVATDLELRVDVRVFEVFWVGLGLDHERRTMTLSTPGASAVLRDQLTVVGLTGAVTW